MLAKYHDVMTTYDPFDAWAITFEDAIRDPFSELFNNLNKRRSDWYRVTEDQGVLTIEVDLPGIGPDDVSLWNLRNQLVVKWKRGSEVLERRINVDGRFDLTTTKAKLAHGLLTLTVNKRTDPEAKRINIEVG